MDGYISIDNNPASEHPLIDMAGICKQFSEGASEGRPVLKSVDLTIGAGEFVSIMGPSGSGKTTLMNLLGTLDHPTSGTYRLDGEDITNYDDNALAHIRNHSIGFVFQGFNLLPRRTVIENIALPLLYANMDHKERIERAEYYLAQVGLSTHRDYFPTQLSGGQQQRIAIARALGTHPKLILADEPTGNLDTKTSNDIMNLFTDLNHNGKTIVLVTHEHNIAKYGERLVHIKDGEVIYDGPMY